MSPAPPGSIPHSVADAFRLVVARGPDRTALEAGDEHLTYAELDRQSNRVANRLLAQGGNNPVAMITPLEPTSIVAMLGALKAGRAFVPLDPRDPPDRLRQLLDEVGPHLWLEPAAMDGDQTDDPRMSISPEQASLVYFTSGSSGRPRGVIKSHEHLTYPTVAHGIVPGDRVAVILPLAFAGAISMVFGPILAGATGCLFDPITQPMGVLAEWIDDRRVTCFQTSPSALRAIAAELEGRGRTAPGVRLIIIGGEACEPAQLQLARRVFRAATFANHYGSTEAGFIAVTRIAPDHAIDPGVTLFRDLYPDQDVEIVDDDGRPVAVGDRGEVRVSSRRVALGYWGETGRSARSIADRGHGVRTIQLGDRARRHPDGALELVGRSDLRAKVHGQAVDLEDVERALSALPSVREAVVTPVPGRNGETELVAHVVAAERGIWLSPRQLRIDLSATVRPYQMPARFYRVDAIPRTPRGKIDREWLRQTAAGATPIREAFVAPRNAGEAALAVLVGEALGLDRVGVRDDIFDLGLDSLSAVGLLGAVNARFGVTAGWADLLEAPTVEALAKRVLVEGAGLDRAVFPLSTGGSGAPIFCAAGGGGGGTLAMRRLGKRLGRPTFSFVARGFERRAWPDRTVERAAARYVQALRTVQPTGPWLIAGLSFGGLVALEMARQIEASGGTVALLVLIDPVSRGPRRPLATRLAPRRPPPPSAVAGPVRRTFLWRLRTWVASRYKSATVGLIVRAPMRQHGAFFQLNATMARRYGMRPYGGRCLLLRTVEWEYYDELDYRQFLTGEVEEQRIPGSHLSMVAEPHLATMARLIREALDRVTAAGAVSVTGATRQAAGPGAAAEAGTDPDPEAPGVSIPPAGRRPDRSSG